MFMMRWFIVFLIFLFAPSGADAGESELAGAEITAALSGNTAIGDQKGMLWRQYFAINGDTVYIVSGKQPSPGKWRVSGDNFCSLWPPSTKWDCYSMTGAGDNVTWIYEGGGDPWPAKMVSGDQSAK